MSVGALGWVFDHSTATGVTFTVHIAIADSVNDQNRYEFWMDLGTLAAKARTTRATASRSVSWLVENGYLELLTTRTGGRSQPARYRFLYRGSESRQNTVSSPQNTVSDPPKVCAEPQEPCSERARKEPKTTTTQKQQLPAPAAQKPEPDPVRRAAKRVVDEWWEWRQERGETPVQPYIAVLRIVDTALRQGVSVNDMAAALQDTPTVTGAALEFALSKRRGRVGRPPPNLSPEAAALLLDDYGDNDHGHTPPEGRALPSTT